MYSIDPLTLRWIRDGFDSNPNWTTSVFADGVVLSCTVYRKDPDSTVFTAEATGKTNRVKHKIAVELDAFATAAPCPPREWLNTIGELMEHCREQTAQQHKKAEFLNASAPRCNRKCKWYAGAWCMCTNDIRPTKPGYRCSDYERKAKTKDTARTGFGVFNTKKKGGK